MRFQGGPSNQTRTHSFCFYFKGKQKQKNPTNPVQNPIFQCQPCPPPPGVNPWLRPVSPSHCAPLPSPAPPEGCRFHGPGGPDPGAVKGRKETGWQLLTSLSPGLQPWLQEPTLALINPFLATLLGGEADLGEFPPHPSLPRGLLGAVLTEVGGLPLSLHGGREW